MTEDRLVNILLVIGMGIIVGALILLIASTAHGGVCLSKSEARKLWPKKHLYWYSSEHCWSDRRGPPRGIKIEPIHQDPIFPKQSMAQATEPDPAPLPAPLSFLERWYEFPKVFSFFRRLVNPDGR
jgi:hypothetical protein